MKPSSWLHISGSLSSHLYEFRYMTCGNNELKNPQEKYRTGAEQIQTSKKLEAIAGAMEE